eukprot:SAG31_NODE_1358_length_8643_cov_11.893375_4_plen_987_part_00
MGKGLYNDEPGYRLHFDKCCELVIDLVSVDLREALFVEESSEVAEPTLNDPIVVQTAMFACEYAVAMTLLDMGIKPLALIGHSIGEYAAAAVSGVLRLQDALRMVVIRAKVMHEKCATGSMLSVLMSKEAVREFVAGREDLWVACENSPTNQVLAGSHDTIDAVAEELTQRNIRNTKLHVSHAFHSGMVAPAAAAIRSFAETIELFPPSIPITSNVTGLWNSEPTAEYWAEHIVGTVKFSENVETVLKWKPMIILECGPGSTLCSLVGKCCQGIKGSPTALQTMRHPKAVGVQDQEFFAGMLGKLWAEGVELDWDEYHKKESVLRAPIPTYCFEKTSLWSNPTASIYVHPGPERSKKRKRKMAVVTAAPASDICIYFAARKPNPVGVKVYCFPFAGGSSGIFASLATGAPEGVEVVAVEPIGRGARSGEERVETDEGDAAEIKRVAEAIVQDAGSVSAIVFIGFSMGALTAIEVAMRVDSSRIKHLFLAGRVPPAVKSDVETTSGTSKASLGSLNLAPPEVVQSEEWETFFKPLLLADLAADARADRRVAVALEQQSSPLRCAVDILCGMSDESFPFGLATSWERVSSARPFDYHFFPGGHDFLKNSADAIFRRVLSAETLISARALAYGAGANRTRAGGIGPSDASTLLHTVQWERLHMPQDTETTSVLSTDGAVVVLTPDLVTGALPTAQAEHSEAMANGTLVLSLLGAPDNNSKASGTNWLAGETMICWGVVQFCQQLMLSQAIGRLVVVTPAATTGALAVGVLKTFPLEYPEITIQRVFVDETPPPDGCTSTANEAHASTISAAVEAARRWPSETDILLQISASHRQSLRAPRLVPVPRTALIPASAALDGFAPHRTSAATANTKATTGPAYIVTGGMGGVGSALVNWLIDVQRVPPAAVKILTRRASPSGGHPRGATVVSVDVSDSEALCAHKALRSGPNDGCPDGVAGIFHLAGILEDGLLSGLTQVRYPSREACSATFG